LIEEASGEEEKEEEEKIYEYTSFTTSINHINMNIQV